MARASVERTPGDKSRTGERTIFFPANDALATEALTKVAAMYRDAGDEASYQDVIEVARIDPQKILQEQADNEKALLERDGN